MTERVHARPAAAPALPRVRSAPYAHIPSRVHLLGAGGAGVSGAARILAESGHETSGHDRAESDHTRLLESWSLPIEIGPTSTLPDDTGLLVRSAAVPKDDPSVVAARERGIPVWKYGELLGALCPPRRTLAVAGTHGKTTTSWLAYHALRGLEGPRPGALIGGICRELDTNALAPQARGWFVVEACEYDRTFLNLRPSAVAITNVDADHLDYYGSFEAIVEAFRDLARLLPRDGLLVVGAEVPEAVERAAVCPVWRFGRELKVELFGESLGRFRFRLLGPGFDVTRVKLGVAGEFNVENAALALGLTLGTAGRKESCSDVAADSLGRFIGSKRRFEPWGAAGETEVVHDYAHHPTEVRVTLEAARRALPGKPLHVLFQPHQVSRTARFLDEFAESLRFADRVVVADVYGARAHIDGAHQAGAPELADALCAARVDACAPGGASQSARAFAEGLPERSAALVLGAGDIDQIRDELFDHLALRGARTR